MDAYNQNQDKQLALASVNGSYHRQYKQDPFLMAWLADFESLNAKSAQKKEATKMPDSTYSC